MPRHPSDPELKAEFASRVGQVLENHSAREIATVLGVRPQMVYNYRDGKNAPSPEVIRKAMEAWPEFILTYRGKTFALKDFQRRPGVPKKTAYQYELWDAIKKLDSESIEIEILKKESDSLKLGVRIRFRNK